MRKLGIIAGGGDLPGRLAEAYEARGGVVFMLALDGVTGASVVAGRDHAWVKIGRLQETMDHIAAAGVEDVVMAGPVRRPALSSLELDGRATRVLFKAGARAFGDDGMLSVIVEEIERDGFRVIGADSILAQSTAPEGLIAGGELDPIAVADIKRGIEVLRSLGPADVGQGVAIQEGLVLAIEAVEGTDAMIKRAGVLKRDGVAPILVKISKPDQDRRMDLPTIGLDTVRKAAAAGFRGIAIEAGGTLLVDPDEVRQVAEETNIFITGVQVRHR